GALNRFSPRHSPKTPWRPAIHLSINPARSMAGFQRSVSASINLRKSAGVSASAVASRAGMHAPARTRSAAPTRLMTLPPCVLDVAGDVSPHLGGDRERAADLGIGALAGDPFGRVA